MRLLQRITRLAIRQYQVPNGSKYEWHASTISRRVVRTKSVTMNFVFELWGTVNEVHALDVVVNAESVNRRCLPKMEATNFNGLTFGCNGERLLFQRNNEGAEFRLTITSGEGGVHEVQESGRVLVIPKAAPYVFKLPTKRQWTITSKKLKGKHTMAREITIAFSEVAGGDQNEIRIITITIPITKDSDQAHVFTFGLLWAAKVVDANLAHIEFYAAVNACAYRDVHDGP